MKTVIYKDLKNLLGSRVMCLVAFTVLQFALIPGICIGKINLITTTLKCMVFIFLAIVLYFLFESASIYMRNIQSQKYFAELKEKGLSARKVLLSKYFIGYLTILVFSVLFVGAFALDSVLIYHKFPEVADEMSKLDMNSLLGDTSHGVAIAAVIAGFSYCALFGALLSIAFMSVTLSYVYFARQKFSGLSAMFVFMTFFLLFMLLDSRVLGKLVTLGGRVLTVTVYLVIAVLGAVITWVFYQKKINQ